MTGLLNHLALTLRLNFRSRMAIIYGYVVPIFFLVAFAVFYRATKPPLVAQMGQLLTVTVLGGACFGMPTSMVAERERGVWRRYRLLPTAIGGIILSAMVGRFVIVLSAAVIQVVLAKVGVGTPLPAHPVEMFAGFAFVSFAFLGLGLIIAMVADTVPAVQALGQAIFLPMLMIGGVGYPLERLPPVCQHVAGFLPGRYAVEVLQACQNGKGLPAVGFPLVALVVIGLSTCVVGARLFRWDAGQRVPASNKAWVGAALIVWAGVGLAAEMTKRQVVAPDATASIVGRASNPGKRPSTYGPSTPATQSTTAPGVETSTTLPVGPTTAEATPSGPPAITQMAPWEQVTRAQAASITYDDVPDDDGTEVPLAHNLDDLEKEGRERLEGIADKLAAWEPGKDKDLGQRVRSLLSVAGVADVLQDQQEGQIPFVIFEKLKGEAGEKGKDRLIQAVTWVILNPDEGTVETNIKEFTDMDIGVAEETVRIRTTLYGKKLLFRLLGREQVQK